VCVCLHLHICCLLLPLTGLGPFKKYVALFPVFLTPALCHTVSPLTTPSKITSHQLTSPPPIWKHLIYPKQWKSVYRQCFACVFWHCAVHVSNTCSRKYAWVENLTVWHNAWENSPHCHNVSHSAIPSPLSQCNFLNGYSLMSIML